jgi:iron(III) transport system permease protein
MLSRFNIWYLSSFFISLIVAVPILMIFGSFFETTTEYSSILKETFLLDLYF